MRISDWSSDVCSSDLIEQGRKRGPRHAQHVRRRRDRQAHRLDDLMLDETAGVGRVLQADTCNRSHSHLLVGIFIGEVEDLDLVAVDPKRHPPVFGDEQAPRSLAVAGQHMGLPARHGAKLVLPLHVLKESDHAPDLGDNGGLKAAFIVMFDESPQSLVDHVSDLHGDFYLDYRSASSYAIRFADGSCTQGTYRAPVKS